MSFDQDPYVQANISAADFSLMCDEIKQFTEQRDELLAALKAIEMGCSFPDDDVQRAVRDRARAAIAKVEVKE